MVPELIEGLTLMQTALRVLTAMSEGREPAPDDVAELNTFDPSPPDRTPDELACDVLQKVLRSRVQLRLRTGGA